jgi:hypothetical protein
MTQYVQISLCNYNIRECAQEHRGQVAASQVLMGELKIKILRGTEIYGERISDSKARL